MSSPPLKRKWGLIIAALSLLLVFTSAQWDDGGLSFIDSLLRMEPEGFSEHIVARRDVNKDPQECKPLKKNKNKLKECKAKGKFPVQDECRTFLICKEASGKPTPTCCPEGLHFDHRVRTCIGRQDAHCLNMCKENGTRYPDPKNLKQFLECGALGIPEEVPCPEGEHFAPKEGQCKPADKNVAAAVDTGLDDKMVDDIIQGYEFPPQAAKEGNATAGKNETQLETDEKGNVKGVSEAPDVDYKEEGSTPEGGGESVTETSLPLCSAIAGLNKDGSTTAAPEGTTAGTGEMPSTTDDDEPDCIPDDEVEVANNGTSGVKKMPQGRFLSFNFEAEIKIGGGGGGGANKGGAANKGGGAGGAGGATTKKPGAKGNGVLAPKSTSGCRAPTKREEGVMPTCPKEESYPIKDECKLFRKCYGEGKAPVFTCCPAGMKFHHVMRVCVQEKNARCTRVCPKVGIKYPHPKTQKSYLMCTKKGWPEDFDCKEGHRFDNTKKECVEGAGGKGSGTSKSKAGGEAGASGGAEAGAGGKWTSLNETDELDVDAALADGYTFPNATEEEGDSGEVDGGGNGTTTVPPDGASTTIAPGGSSTTVAPDGSTTTVASGGSSTTVAPGGSSTTGASDGSSTTTEAGGSTTVTPGDGSSTTTAAPSKRRKRDDEWVVLWGTQEDGQEAIANQVDYMRPEKQRQYEYE